MYWKTLCEAIRLERLKRRLKQSDIADKAGISHATLGGWENGEHCPVLDKFIMVLDALGLELKIVRKKEQ